MEVFNFFVGLRHFVSNITVDCILITTGPQPLQHDLPLSSNRLTMASSTILIPGQPLPANFTQPPLPQPGSGCYLANGQIIASILGRPRRDGAVVHVIGREEAGAVPDIGATVSSEAYQSWHS